MKKSLFALILVFGIIAFFLYRNFTPDDAYIHIGYAKDILSGKGYSFAANRTYGSTAPLWPPLISLVSIVLRSLEISAKFLSLAFAVGSILMMFYTAKLRFNPAEAFVAAFLLAVNAYFLRWSLSGMEASAACFFMILLTLILYKENDKTVKRSLFFLLGFAPLIRPEFYLIILIFFAYLILKQRGNFDFVKLAMTTVPTLVWLCFAEAYYGTILPTTFLVKAGEPFLSLEFYTIWRNTKLFLSGNLIEIGFSLIAAICLFVFREPDNRDAMSEKLTSKKVLGSESLLLIVFIISFFGFYGLKDVVIISRYSLALVPLIILITIDMASHLCENVSLSRKARHFVWAALVVGSTSYNSLFTAIIVKPDADKFYEGFQKHYIEIATMIKKLNTGDSHIALSDVGIMGVYSGCYIDDLNGLVDNDRFKYKDREEYIRAKQPNFLVLHGELDSCVIGKSYRKIYTTTLPPFGINGTQDVNVEVYQRR